MSNPLRTLQGMAQAKAEAELSAQVEEFNELEGQSDERVTLAECQAMPQYREAVAAFAEACTIAGLNIEVLNKRDYNAAGEVEDYVQCEAWK